MIFRRLPASSSFVLAAARLRARLMVYFVLALWLFRGRNSGYGQVMTKLADGLYHQRRAAGLLAGQQLDPDGWVDAGGGRRWRQPNISSLSRGRGKLGPAPGRFPFQRGPGAPFPLKPVKVRAGGPSRAELAPPRPGDGPPLPVRVIEYTVHTAPAGGGGREETSELFCLVTDLLDPQEYPALDLACCYPRRWGCETVIGHHKTGMGDGQPVLRSKDPAGVEQEMLALFAACQAIRKITGIGAAAAGSPPDKISFPHALAAATDTVAAFSP